MFKKTWLWMISHSSMRKKLFSKVTIVEDVQMHVELDKELRRAEDKYGRTFNSDNEALGTIDIEAQEAREAIHSRDYEEAYKECMQVAAMGLKAARYFKSKQ